MVGSNPTPPAITTAQGLFVPVYSNFVNIKAEVFGMSCNHRVVKGAPSVVNRKNKDRFTCTHPGRKQDSCKEYECKLVKIQNKTQ